MAKLAHTDHLNQGEGRAVRTRKNGSHLDPASSTGAFKQKSSGSHLDQGEGGAKPRAANAGGSHLTPHPALSDKTSVRGGGTRRGHDRTNPTAGKSKSGSKFSQHPNNRKSK